MMESDIACTYKINKFGVSAYVVKPISFQDFIYRGWYVNWVYLGAVFNEPPLGLFCAQQSVALPAIAGGT